MIKLPWCVHKWEFSLVPKVCATPKFVLKLPRRVEVVVWCLFAGRWITLCHLCLSALLNQGRTLGPRMFGVSKPTCLLVMVRRSWVAALRWAAGDTRRSRGCQVFFKSKIFLLPLIYTIRFNYQGRNTNENHDGCLFYRAASWTLLRAKEEEGPRCAATFVKVLSPMQQPVAILGVNLEFLIHIWVAFIILSLTYVCFGSVGLQQQRATSQKSLWTGWGAAGGFGH